MPTVLALVAPVKVGYAGRVSKQDMPPEISRAMAHLDAAAVSWSEETRKQWVVFRGFARKHQRISQAALPAVGVAAQEMVQVRDHAHRALEAMEGVFGQPVEHDDEPDTTKHGKPLPADPDDER